jgi:hypothetical protein
MFFQAVAALFAVYMLVRHLPRAAAALRGGGRRDRAGSATAILTVVLALAILVVAVKALTTGLIKR